jgi:glycosyltransferase involved in cell wall biosynthesis
MPAYNADAFIEQSIISVLAQSYTNWQLIVIDDGSTDGTAAIVKQYQKKDNRITYHFQNNQGLGAARNTGFKLVKGQWIAFLDADDLWLENKLQVQMATAINSNADVVFTSGYYLDKANVKPYESLTGNYNGHALYKILLNHNHIAILSVCIKKALADNLGAMDTNLLVFGNEDWDYWLRACKFNAVFIGLKDKLFKYRVHDKGISANTQRMLMGSYYLICKNYDSSLLNNQEQRYQQFKLLTAIPFILKSMFKWSGNKPKNDFAALVFKILAASFPVLPAFSYNLFKSRFNKTAILNNCLTDVGS